MGKKHASQYANFGWLLESVTCRSYIRFSIKDRNEFVVPDSELFKYRSNLSKVKGMF